MASTRSGPASLAALGLGPGEERLYLALLRTPSMPVDEAAGLLDDEAEVEGVVGRLVDAGLVHRDDSQLVAASPEQALEQLIGDEHDRLEAMRERLMAVRSLVPALEAEHRSAQVPVGEPVEIESFPAEEVFPILQRLVRESPGDLLWMRSDQWRLPVARDVDAWVRRQLLEGRRSRVLYPARVLEESPMTVRGRADLGEDVRILGSLPGRLAIIGESAAVMPHRFDNPQGTVLIVRQPAVVQSLRLLFEALWERGLVVPGIGADDAAGGAGARRLILDQLARGAKDEQIARTLGLSLRTVRRRVSDLLDDLEATSRFQAGVEAVRRGWL